MARGVLTAVPVVFTDQSRLSDSHNVHVVLDLHRAHLAETVRVVKCTFFQLIQHVAHVMWDQHTIMFDDLLFQIQMRGVIVRIQIPHTMFLAQVVHGQQQRSGQITYHIVAIGSTFQQLVDHMSMAAGSDVHDGVTGLCVADDQINRVLPSCVVVFVGIGAAHLWTVMMLFQMHLNLIRVTFLQRTFETFEVSVVSGVPPACGVVIPQRVQTVFQPDLRGCHWMVQY